MRRLAFAGSLVGRSRSAALTAASLLSLAGCHDVETAASGATPTPDTTATPTRDITAPSPESSSSPSATPSLPASPRPTAPVGVLLHERPLHANPDLPSKPDVELEAPPLPPMPAPAVDGIGQVSLRMTGAWTAAFTVSSAGGHMICRTQAYAPTQGAAHHVYAGTPTRFDELPTVYGLDRGELGMTHSAVLLHRPRRASGPQHRGAERRARVHHRRPHRGPVRQPHDEAAVQSQRRPPAHRILDHRLRRP